MNEVWRRWALSRFASVRVKLRAVTGIYNQWPIVVDANTHYLPIGRLPDAIVCLANDNQ